MLIAYQSIALSASTDAVGLGFDNPRGVTLHPNSQRVAEVQNLFVRHAELACELKDTDLLCSQVVLLSSAVELYDLNSRTNRYGRRTTEPTIPGFVPPGRHYFPPRCRQIRRPEDASATPVQGFFFLMPPLHSRASHGSTPLAPRKPRCAEAGHRRARNGAGRLIWDHRWPDIRYRFGS